MGLFECCGGGKDGFFVVFWADDLEAHGEAWLMVFWGCEACGYGSGWASGCVGVHREGAVPELFGE